MLLLHNANQELPTMWAGWRLVSLKGYCFGVAGRPLSRTKQQSLISYATMLVILPKDGAGVIASGGADGGRRGYDSGFQNLDLDTISAAACHSGNRLRIRLCN